MINYTIQVMLFQALFLAVYDFFLKKETFFKWNRLYLLGTPFLAFIIPLLKFESFTNTVPQEYIVQLPTVIINPQAVLETTVKTPSSLINLTTVFYAGIVLFILLFFVRLFKIVKLINTHKVINKNTYKLVLLNEKQSAFSFFNFIFIHKSFLEKEDLQIIKHELVHCKQYHSVDLLLFEILKIAMWFNPLVYVFQHRITVLHEYISDAEVVKEVDKKSYFNKLLAETFNVEHISFINQFYKQSLIKKRIAMITKNKSQKMKQLKYLLLIPLLFSMLLYMSCTKGVEFELEDVENALNKENVISDGKYFEGKNGKMFLGTSLAGKEVMYEDFTEKEKDLFDKFSDKDFPNLEMKIVIDTNGDRVLFLKTNFKSVSTQKTYEYEKGEDVPFSVIDEVPVFPGCEGSKEQLKECLQEKITEHISVNFNSDLANDLNLQPGVKRIFVLFKIDKDGTITDVQARAPHQSLADEAIRVVNSLPKMIPGKQRGEVVGVKYSLPIAFKVE